MQKLNRENYLLRVALGGGISIGYGKPCCFRLKSCSKEQKGTINVTRKEEARNPVITSSYECSGRSKLES